MIVIFVFFSTMQHWLARVNDKEKIEAVIRSAKKSTNRVANAKETGEKVTNVLLRISREQTRRKILNSPSPFHPSVTPGHFSCTPGDASPAPAKSLTSA